MLKYPIGVQTFEEIRTGGYHFSASAEGVYNPFSLLNTLQDKEFNDYWFETGTPSFLVSLIKNTSYDISALQGEEVDSSLLVSVNSAFANPIPLLYQSGYLTITGYDREVGLYRLDFPNKEKDFQYAVSTIFELLSEDVQTDKCIYVMEFKVNGSADSALRQIEEKGYVRPFSNDGRRIFRIGVNFSTATRRIEDWKIEQCIKTKAI